MEDVYSNTKHKDPHCCSKICTFLQADVFGDLWCHEDMKMECTITVRWNEWVPPLSEWNTLSVIYRLKNYEIVVKIDLDYVTMD